MEKDPSSPDFEAQTASSPEKKHVPLVIGIIVILLIAGAIYWFMRGQVQAPQANLSDGGVISLDTDNAIPLAPSNEDGLIPDESSTQLPPAESLDNQKSDDSTTTQEPTVQVFNITAANFSFTPNEIKVKKGDAIKINLRGNEGMHDFVLDAFGVKTQKVQAGQNATVEFTADKTGTFEYYCSVGNHRAMGMVGKFIVE